METTEKVNVKELKAKIKVAADYQIFLKNQRRTVRLTGKREMEPWMATMKHRQNRLTLRAMYAAYAKLKGRDISEIDSLKFETPWDENKFNEEVEEIVKKYSIES